MPARSYIDRLPEADRNTIAKRLIDAGFSGSEAVTELLRADGYEVTRSGLHRHGQQVQARINRIQASTEAARLIAEAAPDQEDARSAAVIALVQSELFDAMLNLEEADHADPHERVKLLSQAARAIAEASRASVSQKRWADEVRTKVAAAADKAAEIATQGGLGKTQVADLRQLIAGIAA